MGRRRVFSLLLGVVLGSLALAVEAPSRDSRYTENIFVVNADGTGRRNLTLGSSPAQRVLYALSPDGRTLAYGRHGSIEVLPVKGGKARTLVSFSGQNGYSDVGWSRDGKLIAFQMCCDPLGVGVVRPDGTSLSTIPGVSNPAWLPGSRLAFLVGVEIQKEIATANPDGSERRSVLYAKPRESFSGLTVSPNGRKFAFTSSSDQGEWLTSVGPMGIPPDRIARGASEHSWSPTSRRLVFVTEDDGLVTVASDGSGRRRYRAIRSLYPEFPAWSPDGTRIAFRAKYGRLFVMNLRHGSLRVVARSVAREQPLWSPNGRRLYYVASRRS